MIFLWYAFVMPILLKIKKEIEDFSGWFKIVLIVLFAAYISFWFFTINLHDVQKAKQIEPILPVVAEDSEEYDRLSQSIVSGSGFGINGKIETLRTPGYPLFVSSIKVIGGSYFAVTLAQIFLVFISAIFIRKIGIFYTSKRVGEISSLLFLVNPVTLALSLVILTDVLFLFLFIFGSYLAISLKNEKILFRILMTSIVFSLAIYIRMGLFILPIIYLPILASSISVKNKIKSVLLTTLILVMVISPWVVRNYVQTGVISFSSLGAVNLSWMVPKFLASSNGTKEADEAAAFQKATGVPDEEWKNRGFYDIRYSEQINQVAKKIILDRPFSYLKYHIITSIPFLFPSSILFTRDIYNSALHTKTPFKEGVINLLAAGNLNSFFKGAMSVWWKVLERLCWLLAYIIALFGIWNKRGSLLTWSFVFTIGYLMLLAGPASGPRYSFQAWPFIFILFTSGVTYLFEKFNLKNI